MSYLVTPHGGILNPRLVYQHDKDKLLNEANTLYQIRSPLEEVSDVILMATGAFSPLSGFMLSTDYQKVVGERKRCHPGRFHYDSWIIRGYSTWSISNSICKWTIHEICLRCLGYHRLIYLHSETGRFSFGECFSLDAQ
jgi:hypothetical protein